MLGDRDSKVYDLIFANMPYDENIVIEKEDCVTYVSKKNRDSS